MKEINSAKKSAGFQKILVAVDRTPLAPIVFAQALEQARKKGVKLMIFHCLDLDVGGDVTPLIETGVGLDPVRGMNLRRIQQQMMHEEITQVTNSLEKYRQQALEEGITTESDYKIGEPGSWICDVARNWGADLIVIGRRGRKVLSEILMGSVSNYVLHHAPCSVLIVQGTTPTREDKNPTAN